MTGTSSVPAVQKNSIARRWVPLCLWTQQKRNVRGESLQAVTKMYNDESTYEVGTNSASVSKGIVNPPTPNPTMNLETRSHS